MMNFTPAFINNLRFISNGFHIFWIDKWPKLCLMVIGIVLSCFLGKHNIVVYLMQTSVSMGTLYSVIFIYSQLSLSRLRLSRITAYLEEKIWSLFLHRNLKSGYKIHVYCGKEEKLLLGSNFSPFPQYFQ